MMWGIVWCVVHSKYLGSLVVYLFRHFLTHLALGAGAKDLLYLWSMWGFFSLSLRNIVAKVEFENSVHLLKFLVILKSFSSSKLPAILVFYQENNTTIIVTIMATTNTQTHHCVVFCSIHLYDKPYEVQAIIIPIFQVRKMRQKEFFISVTQGYATNKWIQLQTIWLWTTGSSWHLRKNFPHSNACYFHTWI